MEPLFQDPEINMKKTLRRMPALSASLALLVGLTAANAFGNDNEINGKVPEAPTKCLVAEGAGSKSWVRGDGVYILIEPGHRAPGTRSPVHTHPHSGATCVIQGEMTLTLEGHEDQTFTGDIAKGEVNCYPMPAPVSGGDENKMSATNTGSGPALIIDIFPVPEGDDWESFKPMCVLQNEGLDSTCYTTGSGCEK